jgi:hypothetical protein
MKLLNTIPLALFALTAAAPVPQGASSVAVFISLEEAEADRHGVSFNDNGFPPIHRRK